MRNGGSGSGALCIVLEWPHLKETYAGDKSFTVQSATSELRIGFYPVYPSWENVP